MPWCLRVLVEGGSQGRLCLWKWVLLIEQERGLMVCSWWKRVAEALLVSDGPCMRVVSVAHKDKDTALPGPSSSSTPPTHFILDSDQGYASTR